MPITSLIEAPDVSEVVRDQIATLLLLESTRQQDLARTAGADPAPWELRVFTERDDPWSEFQRAPGSDDEPDEDEHGEARPGAPIVNVSFNGSSFSKSGSNVIYHQQALGVFHIDCYAHAVSRAKSSGHTPGDTLANKEAHRIVGLCRKILMAGTYTYLGLAAGVIGGRWTQSIETFRAPLDARPVQRIGAARLVLEVSFNEYSPQVEGQPIELVSVEVLRSPNGQVLFAAQYSAT